MHDSNSVGLGEAAVGGKRVAGPVELGGTVPPAPSAGKDCFPDAPAPPTVSVMDGMALPPDLEQFAADAVAAGRYRDRAALIAAGVGLLQRSEAEVADFVQSLEEARAEAERDGWLSAEDVHAEMAALIDEARRAKV